MLTIAILLFAGFVMIWTMRESRRRDGIHELAINKMREDFQKREDDLRAALKERDDQVATLFAAQTNHAAILLERSRTQPRTSPRNGIHQTERGIL